MTGLRVRPACARVAAAQAAADPVAHDGRRRPGARSRTRRAEARDPGPTTALVTITTPRRRRRPRASARNVDRSRIGQIRPTGGSGPWPGGGAGPPRPAFVRIRRRKPCFLLRLRLFGWNVLFTHGLLERPGRNQMGPWGAAPHAFDAGAARCSEGVYGGAGPTASTSMRTPTARACATPADEPLAWTRNAMSTGIACCVVHSADMVRDPGAPGDPVLGTSPAIGSTDRSPVHTPPTAASPHLWTHLWTTLGSRHRGDTCCR